MKRNIFVLLIVLFLLVISNLVLFAEESNYDFRKTNWGMSKEQVKATENEKPFAELDNYLNYSVRVNEKDCFCEYYFLEDKLYKSTYMYSFGGLPTDFDIYINDYDNLKEFLTKIYGKPKGDEVVWKNDLYKRKRPEWGTAIILGYLTYGTLWETPATEIVVMFKGIDKYMFIWINYASKELKEWAEQILKEKK